MAISIVASGTTTVAAGSSSISITFTTAAQAGDHIYLSFQTQNTTGFTAPSGFASIYGASVTTGLIYWEIAPSALSSVTFSAFTTTSAARLSYIIVRGAQQAYPALARTSSATATSLATTAITFVTGTSYAVLSIWGFRAANTTITAPTGVTTNVSANATTAIPGAYICSELNVTTANTTARTLTYGVSTAGQAVSIVLVDDTSAYFVGSSSVKNTTSLSVNYNEFNPAHKLLAAIATSSTGGAFPTLSTGSVNVTSTLITSNSSSTSDLAIFELNNTSSGVVAGQIQASNTIANLQALTVWGAPVSSTVIAQTNFGAGTAVSVNWPALTASSSYLVFGVVDAAGPSGDAFTQASGWVNLIRIGTTGGSATSNNTISSGSDIITGVTSVTYNPTLGTTRAWVAALLVYPLGTTTSVTITESATATDSSTYTFSLGGVITESVTATDAQTAIQTANVSITESVTATDSQTGNYSTSVTISEAVTATDSQTGGLAVTVDITESVTATDSQDALIISSASITESVTATDAQTAIETSNAWLTENTVSVNGGFVNTIGFSSGIATVLNVNNESFGVRFIANQTAVAGFVNVRCFRSTTGTNPTQPFKITLWQLASNSLTALPSTNLGEINVNFTDIASTNSIQIFDLSSLNITLTSGVGYAITITASSDITGTNSTVDVLSPAVASVQNYYSSLYTNIIGTYPSSYSNSTTRFLIGLQPVQATADSQIGGFTASADITESVTASESQIGGFTASAAITESVTASDSETVLVVVNADITESVTATDSPSAVETSNAWLLENTTTGPFVLGDLQGSGGITGGTTNANASLGVRFIANQTAKLGVVTFFVRRTTFTVAPTQPGKVTLWQLASNSLTALPSTILAEINFDFLTTLTTTSRNVPFDFSSLNITLTSGVGYAVTITNPSDGGAALNSSYLIISGYQSGADTTRFNYYRAQYSNIAGTYPSSYSGNTLFALRINVITDEATNDSQLAGFAANVDITESVTASDSEDATVAYGVSQTESVTATETQNTLASTFNASITESVNATDSSFGTGGIAVDGGAFAFGPIASSTIADANTNYSTIATQGAVVYLTGVTGTGAVGTVIAKADVNATTTGVFATGNTGTLVATGTANVPVTGVSGTGQIGDEATSSSANVYPTGVFATGQTGTLNMTGAANVPTTGVQGTGQVGQTAVAARGIYEGGAFAFGAIASSTIADANTNYNNIQTQGVEVYLTSVTGTGQTGTLNMTGAANVTTIGVAGTGQIGDEATSADANAYVSGVFATGATGTITMTGTGNVFPTSATGTGQTGTLTMIGTANVTTTGVFGTGQIGFTAVATQTIISGGAFAFGAIASSTIADANANYNEIQTQGVEVYPTGVVGAGQTGTLTMTGAANVTTTGVSGTGQIGDEATSSDANVYAVGNQATGFTGTITMTGAANVPLTGVVGTGQTGTLTMTGDNNIAVTGVQAFGVVPKHDTVNGASFALGPIATAPIGDAYANIPEVIGTAATSVTGVVGTGETGTLTMSGAANVPVTGVSGAGQIGDEATSADANVYLSGVQATGRVGTVTVTGSNIVNVTGVFGTLLEGFVTVAANADVRPNGVSGTGRVGTVTTTSDANVYPIGVQATGQIGFVIIESGYAVVGVQATGYVGTVLVWSDINDNQNPNWQAINDDQAGSWTDINDTQTSNWQNVDDSQTNNWVEVDDGNTVIWSEIKT